MNAQPARKTDHVPVAEYATVAEMIGAYRRLRARTFAKPRVPEPAPEPVAPVVLSIPGMWPVPPAAQKLAEPTASRLTAEALEQLLRELVPVPPASGGALSGREVLRQVADAHGYAVAHVVGPRRTKPLVDARQHAMVVIARHCPHLSLVQIGKLIGGRDHTTVIHALRKFGAWPRPVPPVQDAE